jgi:tetratricopeptide (TPR) repeat protein
MHILSYVLISFLSITNLSDQKPKPAAAALNKKAINLAVRQAAPAAKKDIAIRVLKILDSATNIDPTYYNAYLNKTGSLLELNRTQDALANLYHAIQMQPNTIMAYARAGHIIEYIMGSKVKAMPYYRKAYNISVAKFKKQGRKELQDDLDIAYTLAFYKDRASSSAYLKSIEKYYTKESSSMYSINMFEQLLKAPFTFTAVKNSLSTYLP